ncbi:hypothetical protein [Micromonospora sp. CPCC 206061]|uniref:hypothetical protein n=1 Tax=Micromonospora sp. CPCC 206061 TaxID=3122410 RepID=UPI002FEF06B7
MTLSQSAASAAQIPNSVNQTAFIWNCPTGAPACFPGAQTRVGDVRVGDPIADLCHGNFNGRLKNLVWNQTGRAGAAERTGFLYLGEALITGGGPARDARPWRWGRPF